MSVGSPPPDGRSPGSGPRHRRKLKALLAAYRTRWPQESATVARSDGFVDSRPERARALSVDGQQGAVDGHLNAQAKNGWVKLLPNVERGIRLLREGAPVYEPEDLPEVAAGDPILAEDREPMLPYFLGRPHGRRSSLFVNQGTGQAMKKVWNALINTGMFGPIKVDSAG